MITTKGEVCKCPMCNFELNAHTSVGGDFVPQSGDVTICINCGIMLIFDHEMQLMLLPDETIKELSPTTLQMILKMQEKILRRAGRQHS